MCRSDRDNRVLPDRECPQPKPATTRQCTGPCFTTPTWRAFAWGPVSGGREGGKYFHVQVLQHMCPIISVRVMTVYCMVLKSCDHKTQFLPPLSPSLSLSFLFFSAQRVVVVATAVVLWCATFHAPVWWSPTVVAQALCHHVTNHVVTHVSTILFNKDLQPRIETDYSLYILLASKQWKCLYC